MKYSIGLDIGTGSVGWAVMDEDFNLMNKKFKVIGGKGKRKNLWGVRLLDGAITAAERRISRGTRRRYRRRKYRLNLLMHLFEEEILKKDDSFFIRLEDAFFQQNDEKKRVKGTTLFVDKDFTDKDYYKKYPTVYHLREAIIEANEAVDMRLIFLAIHHMIKYRGHFIYEDKNFDVQHISFDESINTIIQNEYELWESSIFERIDVEKITSILQDYRLSASAKSEALLASTNYSSEEKAKIQNMMKLVVGNKANLTKIFSLSEDEKIELSFSSKDLDEILSNIAAKLSESEYRLILSLQDLYNSMILSGIIKNSGKNTSAVLSSAMVNKFETHKEDLRALKNFVLEYFEHDKYDEIFKPNEKLNNYHAYVKGTGKKCSQEDFYKFLLDSLKETSDTDFYQEITKKTDQKNYLLKQRVTENGTIPYQFHKHELEALMKNQAQYYPEFFTADRQSKITKLLTHRIPYYVGPLIEDTAKSDFAWMKKQKNEKITPWNFDEIVDKKASATNFIERLTNFDTYLPQEKVLPAHSLIYEKFTVFNELTKVKVNGHFLNTGIKERIFNDLFKQNKKVTKKALINYLVSHQDFSEHAAREISGIDEQFLASYASYIDLKNAGIDNQFLENSQYEEMLEEIILYLTVFEDKKLRKTSLEKYESILGKAVIGQLSKKHYTGWGRLSKKLLTEIKEKETGKSILAYLQDDAINGRSINRNFMQLINDDNLSFKGFLSEALLDGVSDIDISEQINQLTGSPALKKGILQATEIVADIVEHLKEAPEQIVIEFARENQDSKRTDTRQKRLLNAYAKFEKEFGTYYKEQNLKDIKISLNAHEDLSEKLFLYFAQNGRCLYSGKSLDINQLRDYQVDHILPQSYIKDDSIENKALVLQDANQRKKDDLLLDTSIIRNQMEWWKKLEKVGLMGKKKFHNLIRTSISENEKKGFVNRQLVETRQITKHVAALLTEFYPETKIITPKAQLTSDFRNKYKLYKNRTINDYHHAHDAYLNSVIAGFLLKKYEKLDGEFIYGDYIKFAANKNASDKKRKYSYFLNRFDEVTANEETGEIFWQPEEHFRKIRKTLDYKQCNIVKKVEENTGQFYNATIYKKTSDSKKKDLIPRKKGLNPEQYGGYSGNISSYSVAVSYQKGKKQEKRLISIPVMDRALAEKDLLGYLTKKYPDFKNIEILVPKVRKYQLFERDGSKWLVASYQERQKGEQLFLPQKYVKLLAKKKDQKYLEEHLAEFAGCYDYLVEEIDKKQLLDKGGKKIAELKDGRSQFLALEIEDKFSVIEDLIQIARFGPVLREPANLKKISSITRVDRYTERGLGINLSDTTLIFQSPTGLTEKRLRV